MTSASIPLKQPFLKSAAGSSVVVHVALMGVLFAAQMISKARQEATPEYKTVTIVMEPARVRGSAVASRPVAPKTGIAVKMPQQPAAKVIAPSSALAGLLSQAKNAKAVNSTKPIRVANSQVGIDVSQTRKSSLRSLLSKTGSPERQAVQLKDFSSVQMGARALEWESLELNSGSSSEGPAGGALTDADIEKVQKILAAHNSQFRDCYEKALLYDDKLSGVVDLLFSVGNTGAVSKTEAKLNQAKGGGTGAGMNQFRSCLESIGRRLVFPRAIAGNQIKFGLMANTRL